ncbi:hypothetical protein K502DRAFT_350948 [Neoconidiobolus thromboides FSU 785]|nr:hypothetical protein K502DRAFT_350948 [Neoconidiobolus thromboides FSU 785]
MEKYSKWRDPGTGIQPFLPIIPQRKNETTLNVIFNVVKNYLFGTILVIIKLPIILLLSLISFISYQIGSVKLLNPLFRGIILSIAIRLLLLLFGFFNIKTNSISLKRGINNKTKIKVNQPKVGELIIVNSSSYLDLLYLQMKYNPVFTKICSKTGRLSKDTLWNSIINFGKLTILKDNDSHELNEFIQCVKNEGLGPIVIFLEGTSTNGRGVLKPITDLFNDLNEDNLNMRVVYIKYPFNDFSPTFPIGNLGFHFIKLISQFKNNIIIQILNNEEANSYIKEKENEGDRTQLIASLLSNVSKLRKLTLNIDDKKEFIEYYNKNNNIKANSQIKVE